MPKKSSSSKQTSLFDIRLKNHEHDVLVLKGSPQDAASALLSGKIALSVKEPFTIRKINLRLYATLRLNWNESVNTTKGSHDRNIHHERKIYEYCWDHMEINKYLNHMYENTSEGGNIVGQSNVPVPLSRNSSTSSLKNLGALGGFRSKSSGNLSGLSSLSRISPSSSSSNLTNSSSSANLKSSNHTLVSGNYEFPFSTILPGDMPESVEGLPGASVIYKLEASIDRGKFHQPMVTKKHLRVVRTLTTDSVELSESVAVDNTWPKKVEYSLNVPSKAIAVGSSVPITLSMVPLLKGLRLGEIKINLCEYYSYMGYVPPVHNGERIIANKTIPRPDDDDPNFQMDKWQVDCVLKIPPSLSKCTQDVDILSNIKVRHKIKFAIGLVNPDGHVSELRASLPISLFISPFVTVKAITDIDQDVVNEEEEEIIFTSDRNHNESQTSLNNLNSNSSSYSSFSGLVAPPLYEAHIYDRLWTDVSPIDSPLNSGTSTPRNHTYQTNSSMQDFSMSPIDSVQLNENLRLLSLQRAAENSNNASSSSTPGERPTFSLDGENNDYFGRRPNLSSRNTMGNLPSNSNLSSQINLGLMSPGPASPAMHLSRTQSENMLNPSEMSQVPSYTQALKSDADEDSLAPVYQPPLPESNIDVDELNKKYESLISPSTLANQSPSPPNSRPKTPLSRGSSSFNLKNLSSKNSSNNSSPSSSRNVSSTNLASLNPSPGPLSVAKPSTMASDRSAAILGSSVRSNSSLSLHNLHFLNKKKDKK